MKNDPDPPCIYCGQSDPAKFKTREHVIAQSFGRFGTQTPVLKCVCDECNAELGRILDTPHARDTFEGVTRYRTGIRSGATRIQKRLTITLADEAGTGDWAFAQLEGIDGATGGLMLPKSQLLIMNLQTAKPENFFEADIPSLKLTDEVYGERQTRKWFVLAKSKEEHDAFVRKLQAVGIDFRPGTRLPTQFFANEANVEVIIEGEVDDIHKRALAKTLMNVAAYVYGSDEVRRAAWDSTRRFVRHGDGKMRLNISTSPFWSGETAEKFATDDSINVAFQNAPFGLVGSIEYYNRMTYSLVLSDNHTVTAMGARFTQGQAPTVLPVRTPRCARIQALISRCTRTLSACFAFTVKGVFRYLRRRSRQE